MPKLFADWEVYERLVARLFAEQLSTDLCVTPNARIKGLISGRSRQIDVLIDARHDTDNSRRIIVDAKKRVRKVDVKDVEAFMGLMEDVGATHGYLVSPFGHTKAAEARAQKAVTIRILPLNRLDDFDPSKWPRCHAPKCKLGRIFWDGYPELYLRVVDHSTGALSDISFIHYVGKCDRCGRFHVRCTTCGDILAPPENDKADFGHQCSCKLPWFWLASVEEDEDGRKSAELHLARPPGVVETVNRRAL
ncbi:restriction endonuclease [Novispirillum sp. DQ9]|uniref:restriction endonuclease n=1 Tax=Novispirillum sp. DQ9 TaxID=3398612 RepID=UPI003C7E7E71